MTMSIEFHYDLDTKRDLIYVVMIARYKNELIFVRHEDRSTWEFPGGHIEEGEHPDDAARREMKEETGAVKFELEALCDFEVEYKGAHSIGRLYFCEVQELGPLGGFEIVEILCQKKLPRNMTYAEIQPHLIEEAIRIKEQGGVVMERMKVVKGDITKLKCDAVVNAANSGLLGGGGVDGAIHRVGGPSILEECKIIRGKQGGCPTGQAVITTAGRLPAKKVIHTVGPVWHGGGKDEAELLANCYKNSMKLAADNSLKVVAFPNISTGVYGYPKEEAAEIAVRTVKELLEAYETMEVVFVCFDDDNYRLYETLI